MKRTEKRLILTLAIATLTLLFAVNVYAIPAAPGSGKTGAEAACRSHAGKLITLDDLPAQRGAPGGKGAPALDPATKDIPLAVIVIGYNNMPYDNNADWANEIFRSEKSLQKYYSDMSFGQFTFTPVAESSARGAGGNANVYDAANDGVIHVTLNQAHKDWSTTNPIPSIERANQSEMLEMFKSALQAAGAYLDFAAYDNNGDGAITSDELAIGFVVAGYEGSYTEDYPHGKTNYLWAHAWSIADANEEMGTSISLPVVGGVTVDSYIAIAEKLDDGSQEPISVLAHELGHYIGLPDLYDTEYNAGAQWGKYDVSMLSVMSGGGWGVDPDGGFIPYSMDAWCRWILGWYTPQRADADGTFAVKSQSYTQHDAYSTLLIPTQHVGEYYLVENRQNTVWDRGLSQDEYYEGSVLTAGLILWHIDDNVYDLYNDLNAINNTDHRPAVMPLFPEGEENNLSFIGKGSQIYTAEPFFDASVWRQYYPHLGAALDLPIYGEGANADKRASRSLSGVKVTFLSDCASEMQVGVTVSSHQHKLSQVPELPATCTEPGRAAYWACGICGDQYADAAGTRAVSLADLVIPPLGHTAPNVNGRCGRCGEKIVGDDEGEGACPYCGENHNGSVLGKLIRFFHSILYFFQRLFRR